MTATIAYRGRLPGARCEPALPRAVDDAIRLDVAAFVGLAERGPVDVPVSVEDPAQYQAIFGDDLPLALDEDGVPTYAALPTAVRSFFDCGGRRAKVVRAVGPGAVRRRLPVRVTSRLPLGDDLAFTALALGIETTTPSPPGAPRLELPAAFEGSWARQVTVDATVTDEVLALDNLDDGVVTLTDASAQAIDPGDLLLVTDAAGAGAGGWYLWVDDPARLPSASVAIAWAATSPLEAGVVVLGPSAPPVAWSPTSVVRRLRLTLTVRRSDGVSATVVERLDDLRLGPAPDGARTKTRSWSEALQPADGTFDRGRSMFLRAPGEERLVPVLGSQHADVEEEADVDGVEPFTAAALADDGLGSFDIGALFLDPSLTGHTVDGLRLALEVLGLDHDPRPRGVHAIALDGEVAIVAVPDAYHRPWTEQAVLAEPALPVPDVAPAAVPPGFHACEPAGEAAGPPVVPVPALPPAVLRLVVDPPSAYDAAPLRSLFGAVVDLCAARADMVAVLGLPRHATLADAHRLVDPLSARPAAGVDVLSYAGLWHPWPSIVEERSAAMAPLRPVPPDGMVCGTIAATERRRGVWIEPAGQAFAGAVAADLADASNEVAMFDAGLNVVRRRPGGFVATSAHSLSADRSLLQLSVRRLLIWLRKLALREGTRFVFAADDERFRYQIAALFERHLGRLRSAGALVAFEVVVADVATAVGPEEGRVRIDLKVAPTSPVEFLTVTLLGAGEDLLQVGGR